MGAAFRSPVHGVEKVAAQPQDLVQIIMTNGIPITCPHCSTVTEVAQLQGDRCPKCGFEFKWFGPGEERMARDYLEVLTGEKYLQALPEARGFVVAHE